MEFSKLKKKTIKQRNFSKFSYSYFYEAYDAFDSQNNVESAIKSFKLLIICKIMLNQMDDVNNLLNGKHAVKYCGRNIEAMR